MKAIKLVSIISLILIYLVSSVSAFDIELLNTDPAPIIAGDYADITLKITNSISDRSNTKENVTFNIKENNLIQVIRGNEDIIPIIGNGESYTRTFRAFFSNDLEQGLIDLQIIVKSNSGEFKSEKRVYIESSKRKPELLIGELKTTPNELLIDTDNNKLKIKIQNLGDIDAELIKARLIVPKNIIIQSHTFSLEDSLSTIGAGEEGELEFTIDLEKTDLSVIPVTIELRYRYEKSIGNSYETKLKTIDFKIPLIDSPYLIVENVTMLSEFISGSVENKVMLTIKNIGKADATDVRVRVVPDISYPFIFEEVTQYVSAKIKSNATANIIFTAEVSKDAAAKPYDMTVIMESLIEDTRYTRDDIITLSVAHGKKTNNNKTGGLIVGAILIVSLLIWNNTRKKRNKK